jgi:signal transduction histidine kinase
LKEVRADKRVSVLFYLLAAYIFLQFIWWAYLLIDLNLELYASEAPEMRNKKILMVIGEGAVFFSILIAGLVITRNSIRKEISLIRQQRNFLLSITHELKTPISAIRLCLETLSKHQNLDSEKRINLQENALDNTSRLNELIDNVLLATRIESGENVLTAEWTNISDLTNRVLNRFTGESSENISQQVEDGIELRVDPSAYDSILSNLIENALKYGENKPVIVSLKSTSTGVQLTVRDQGSGISDEMKKKIFTKFDRVQNEETRSQNGTGLGLYIVKELVELHKGKIKIESNQSGSLFTVDFPS